ncbi:hypothetical protein T05_15012 [Trichinella murrelli]|uniref:Uncharacterized protein n=1 Tax=Trichinella murrelli TaxID=144512 RepID=A0A0V0T445_9BILA|nr:hypothetical protein T05_15012 [Trichinella murrelli]
MDKPYAVTILKRSQAAEPAMAVCIDKDTIFARFNAIAAQILADNVFTFDYLSYREMPMSLKIIFKIVPFYKKFYSFYTNKIFSVLPVESQFCQILYLHRMQNAKIIMHNKMQIGPARNEGKLLASDSPNDWANGAAPVTQPNGHSFAVALTNVVRPNPNVKFLAYNNVPPAVPNVSLLSAQLKEKMTARGLYILFQDFQQQEQATVGQKLKLRKDTY